jgi:hypothetical protein
MLGDVGRMRKWKIYRAAKRAALLAGDTDAFRIVHMSIQGNHVHMIVEATDEKTLAGGVQRFEILLAKSINRALARKGKVIEFRYHRVDITTPRQMRNALSYVLNNWRRHREDVTTPGAENALIDPYSTAWAFDGWVDLEELPAWDRLPSAGATTWLLRVGWRRHGRISVREVPGALADRVISRRARTASRRRTT